MALDSGFRRNDEQGCGYGAPFLVKSRAAKQRFRMLFSGAGGKPITILRSRSPVSGSSRPSQHAIWEVPPLRRSKRRRPRSLLYSGPLGMEVRCWPWTSRRRAGVNGLSGIWHPLDLVLLAITWAGVPLIVLAVALAVVEPGRSAWRAPCRHRLRAVVPAGSVSESGDHPVRRSNQALRRGVTHLLIAPSTDSSFPSDHATAVFSIVFAYLLHKRFGKALLFAIARIARRLFADLCGNALCRGHSGRPADGPLRRRHRASGLCARNEARSLGDRHPLARSLPGLLTPPAAPRSPAAAA